MDGLAPRRAPVISGLKRRPAASSSGSNAAAGAAGAAAPPSGLGAAGFKRQALGAPLTVQQQQHQQEAQEMQGDEGKENAGPSGNVAAAAGASEDGAGGAASGGAVLPLLPRKPAFRRPAFTGPRPLVKPPQAHAAAADSGATAGAASGDAGAADGPSVVWAVLYTKSDKWKKKSGRQFADGILELSPAGAAQLFDTEGKLVAKSPRPQLPKGPLESGGTVALGSYVCELDREVALDEFRRGVCFVSDAATASAAAAPSLAVAMPQKRAAGPAGGAGSAGRALLSRARGAGGGGGGGGGGAGGSSAGVGGGGSAAPAPAPLFDPSHPDAVLLNGEQWANGEGRLPNGRPVVPVMIDPYLARHMRPHQREGVRWLYQGVMGLRAPGRHGVILADEMGLGKTLQTLALIWTLMRQGPEGTAVVRKSVVVAPASLVNNWAAEVKKWVGPERMRAMVLSSQGATAEQQVSDFRLGSVWHVLIASYESMRRFGPQLAGCCDLLVCDEGHRLKKAGGNKTIAGLQAVGCDRRVVLTGTPVQNNLEEFYALLSFATPGVLGAMAVFKRVFADPISRSHDKEASPADRELGAARAAELQQQAGGFVLRRTQDVLTRHLPPLSAFTLFVKPSELQVSVYRAVLKSPAITSLLYGGGGSDEGVLPAISVLKKLCNHPRLLAPGLDAAEGQLSGAAAAAAAALQSALTAAQPAVDAAASSSDGTTPLESVESSGKLACLGALLDSVLESGCRAVVVSTSTATLDLVDAALCRPRGWATARIDGSTGVEERQAVVDRFNRFGMGRVFLLSTRAGGAGLNLVGANHLVLYDSDWNPAMDLQAMARIWRDGQTKPCYVYRLLTTGTLEEKVYQRQIMKGGLAAATMDKGGSSAGRGLSQAELKQLFRLGTTGSGCGTREVVPGGSADAPVEWLELGGSEVAAAAALAAAVATGLVTDVNRAAKAVAAPTDAAPSAGSDGGGDGESGEAEDGGGGEGGSEQGEEEGVSDKAGRGGVAAPGGAAGPSGASFDELDDDLGDWE